MQHLRIKIYQSHIIYLQFGFFFFLAEQFGFFLLMFCDFFIHKNLVQINGRINDLV